MRTDAHLMNAGRAVVIPLPAAWTACTFNGQVYRLRVRDGLRVGVRVRRRAKQMEAR